MTDFNADALRPMLIERNGNISDIAERLGVDSEELRVFVMTTPLLRRAMDEVISRGVDGAVSVLFAGLGDEHYANQLAAAKEFLKSRPAQRRGFHQSSDVEVKVSGRQGGALTLTWLPPEDNRKPEPPLIEGKVEE